MRQVTDGKIKAAGISNFGIQKIKDLTKTSKTKPAVLQVEIHPYWCANPLLLFCPPPSPPLSSHTHKRPA